MKYGRAIATGLALTGAAVGGHVFGPESAVPAPVVAEADSSPQDESALCFGLVGLRGALGPEGRSAIGIFADENNVFGEVYVDIEDLGEAIGGLDSTMDPDADGAIDNTEGLLAALAARSTAVMALDAAADEHYASNGLSDEQLVDFSSLPEVEASLAALEQARAEADAAIGVNGCDATLYSTADERVYPN